MKKKSLFLSLCMCGIAVIFLIIFAVVSIPKDEPQPNNEITSAVNEGNNKGSLEDPYYIYDTETFVSLLSTYGGKTKPVRQKVQEIVYEDKVDENGNVVTDENGNPIKVEKVDENGNVVYADKLDENGKPVYVDVPGQTEVYHFKFLRDVDFSGVSYVTLFNNGENFIGEINGDGKVVKNISISVSKDNLSDFIYVSNAEPKEYSSRIAIFGSTDGAVISNISFENITINVDDSVISYLKGTSNDYFGNDYSGSFKEFVVSSVVAYAVDTTIQANVTASIDSDAYAVYENGSIVGLNSIGGVVGFAQNSTISSYSDSENVKVNVTFVADSGNGGYYFGGVAGYLYNSTIKNIDATVSVKAIAAVKEESIVNVYDDNGEVVLDGDGNPRKQNKDALFIGGVSGYVYSSVIENMNVDFTVNQVESERLDFSEAKTVNNFLYNRVGGVVSVIRANDNTQVSNISNVNVSSTVNMDCIFGGVVYEVRSTDESNDSFVTLKNIIVKSDVDTIKASGIGELLYHTNIEYDENFVYGNYEGTEYNVMLTGSTSFKTYNESGVDIELAVSIISKISSSETVSYSKSDIKLIYSSGLSIGNADRLSITYAGVASLGFSSVKAI